MPCLILHGWIYPLTLARARQGGASYLTRDGMRRAEEASRPDAAGSVPEVTESDSAAGASSPKTSSPAPASPPPSEEQKDFGVTREPQSHMNAPRQKKSQGNSLQPVKAWAWAIHDTKGRYVFCRWAEPSRQQLAKIKPSPEASMIAVWISFRDTMLNPNAKPK